MKVIDLINKSDKPLFTFELLPPPKGAHINNLFNTVEKLIEYEPAYINITYHQQEVEYKSRPDGLLEKQTVWKRPGTVAISAAIQNKYKITIVPHLICGGFTKDDTENALIDLNFLGIRNVLVLRGDAQKGQRTFRPEDNGHAHAIDLLKQVVSMNRGKYLDKDLEAQEPTDFCIGVAGYPEKHAEAPNMKTDLMNLKAKVDAGADYVVTQMFFDNQKYFDFVKSCREIGINVPIVPGIKPISSIKQLSMLPQVFNLDFPEELSSELSKCKTNAEAKTLGIEWSIQQCKELKEFGVPGLHFYTIGHPDSISKVVKTVF